MSNRNAELAKIHLGAKQLGLDPSDKDPQSEYRDMLFNAAGVRSSADLDEGQRHDVIKHLRKCGAQFTQPKRAGKRPHNFDQLPQYITKVEALLADMNLSWSYADSIARNITGGKGRPDKDPGVERLAWVKKSDHWRAIITALTVEQEKRVLLAKIDYLLDHMGKSRNYIEQSVPGLPAKWQRKRRWLRTIVDTLLDKL